MYKGSCLCGKIHYQVNAELSDFGYCHCVSCQKASGSSYGANAGLSRDSFSLTDHESHLREFESSAGKFRAFCSNCGSPLYAYLSKSPDVIRIRLGSLDTPFDKRCQAHTFVSENASWESIDNDADVPQFDEWATRDVLVQSGSRQT
ncbi:MAG: GFA family protein [Algicola sp.]|nr:GFA family protein [Algicola sp.]